MRKIVAGGVLALLCCCWGWSVETGSPNLAAAGAVADPPTIDGKLNDTCWESSGCAGLTHFVNSDMTRIAEPQTVALICFDAANLYIAVTCDEPRPSRLKAERSDRDDRVWQDDCVEFFIDTNAGRQTFYQIVVNSTATVFDRESGAGKEWDADLQVAADTGDESWWVECAIPFADLGGAPEPGDTWGFNVGRERKVQEQLSSWSPTYGDFTQPERFGELVFTDLPVVPALSIPREPMFGLNHMTLSGPGRATPGCEVVRDWPPGHPAPWDYPQPVIRPVTPDGGAAGEKAGARYRVEYRIVDGSEQVIWITQSLEDEVLFRQAVPVSIQPRPRIVDLIAHRLPALDKHMETDTEFGRQIKQIVTATRDSIDDIVQQNLTRDGLMPKEQWEQAAEELSRALDLPYIVWTKSPWKNLQRHEMPPSLDISPEVNFQTCSGGYDSAAFIITNPGASVVEGRLQIEDLRLNGGDEEPAANFSHDCITFREAVFHRLRSGETVADPLPEMGQAKILSVPPGESRQIWLTLNTRDLPPGDYTTTIAFSPFEPDLPTGQIPVNIRVRPVRLLDQMPILTYHWDYFSRDYNEAYVRNLAEHYTNCFSMKTRHVFPEYDEQGNIVEKYDWSDQDRVLHTKLHYARKSGGLVVYSYGIAYDFHRYSNRYGWEFMSEPYKRAFAAHLREFERHLREDIGMGHDEYVVQIWDEAHHRDQGDKAVRAAEFIKETVPEMQTCMDGGPPLQELPEVNPLIDIWIPHMAHLWDNGVEPQVQAWKDTGKPVCGYTTAHPKKALDPHGYFRLQPWKVWQLGLDGSFYWGMYSYGTDIWNDFDGNRHDNVVVYPSPEGPVTSRRWEATREGREDYIALHILRQAATQLDGQRRQQIQKAIQDMVDKATRTAEDLQTFAQVCRQLGDMLEEEIGTNTPEVVDGLEFSARDGEIRGTWTTDRPTAGTLLYRVPGFQTWKRVEVDPGTEHSILLENLPAGRSFEWYLIYWAENRAAGACLDGLSSRHWFRTSFE